MEVARLAAAPGLASPVQQESLRPAFRSFDIRQDCRRASAPVLAIQGEVDLYGSMA